VARCEAAEAISRAAQAGIDEIEHINFLYPDGRRIWNQSMAEMILQKGLFVYSTIQTGWRKVEQWQQKEKVCRQKRR